MNNVKECMSEIYALQTEVLLVDINFNSLLIEAYVINFT
jgi:hypothetical protein